MPRLRKLNPCVAVTISGTAYRFRHGSTLCSPTVKNPLPFPYFRSGHISEICARLGNKGKAGVQRGRANRRCPFSLRWWVGRCPSRGCGNLPRSAERNSSLNFSEKLRPLGTNTLAQFECPTQPVLRNAARIGRTACAVRASQRVGAGIACAAVKPPQLHINYVCVTPAYTV